MLNEINNLRKEHQLKCSQYLFEEANNIQKKLEELRLLYYENTLNFKKEIIFKEINNYLNFYEIEIKNIKKKFKFLKKEFKEKFYFKFEKIQNKHFKELIKHEKFFFLKILKSKYQNIKEENILLKQSNNLALNNNYLEAKKLYLKYKNINLIKKKILIKNINKKFNLKKNILIQKQNIKLKILEEKYLKYLNKLNLNKKK